MPAKVADLDRKQLEEVETLEDHLGVWVVAVEPKSRFANLTSEQLRQLQDKEKEMGVILLAYDPS